MNISIPQLVFGSLIAGLIGSVIHLILGGKPLRLVFSLIFSWIGFWAGQALSVRLGFSFFKLGTINLGIAATSALILGLLGYWIAGDNKNAKDNTEI